MQRRPHRPILVRVGSPECWSWLVVVIDSGKILSADSFGSRIEAMKEIEQCGGGNNET